MKKILLSYSSYVVLLWLYFYYFYPLDSYGDSRYGAISHFIYFALMPLDILILYCMYIYWRSYQWITQLKSYFIQFATLSMVLVCLHLMSHFPFRLAWFLLSKKEGTRTQSFTSWLGEQLVSQLLFFCLVFFLIYLTNVFIHKWSKTWGIRLWLLMIPLAFFYVFIQPIWIDPLFDDFQKLDTSHHMYQALSQQVASMGITDVDMYIVNKSEKVQTYNAYMTGVFDNKRIVLWDTMLDGMEESEVLFITAHELGHYIKKHVYIGTGLYLVLALLICLLLQWFTNKWQASHYLVRTIKLLLVLSLILFITNPLNLYVSREMERSADQFAIVHTEDLSPAIQSYKELAIQSKTDIDPASWIQFFKSTHPSIQDRIDRIKENMLKK